MRNEGGARVSPPRAPKPRPLAGKGRARLLKVRSFSLSAGQSVCRTVLGRRVFALSVPPLPLGGHVGSRPGARVAMKGCRLTDAAAEGQAG